ncbi:MAG TPA: dUTP diphosphatase [Thermoplasmata archaeon]|nr:dUTP diphosphatase [Thermoplasmata archaeon]
MPKRVARVVLERVGDGFAPPLPKRGTQGSACFDIAAAETVTLTRRAVTLVRTGFKMRPPPGTFLEVRPRSGLSTRGVLMVNAPGTIDRDFSGEVRLPMTFLFRGRFVIRAGDRIGQVRVVPDVPTEFRPGSVRPRRTRSGGFGSTGA